MSDKSFVRPHFKKKPGTRESRSDSRGSKEDIDYYYEIARSQWNDMVDRENAVKEL